MRRTEVINPRDINYVVITAFIGGKYVSSVYQLTEDGEFQEFIVKEKTAYSEHQANVNHDVLVAFYMQKEHIPHNCDFCGKPNAEICDYLTKKYGKETFLCRTCLDVYVNERN